MPPHEVLDEELAERYPLVLMAPAGRFFLNSTFGSIDWHRSKMGPVTVHLHPEDAEARGLSDGDGIRIHNDRGSFVGQARVNDAARPGVAFMHKSHWPKLVEGGANANATTPERDADMAGAPTFHDNRVEVEPLYAGARRAEATLTTASRAG